jgi:hypothetical protein
MTTIYVVTAEKQYSSPKVLAAFDTAEAAAKLVETIEAVEPRWTVAVHSLALQTAGAPVIGTAMVLEPFKASSFVTTWNGPPEEVDAQGRAARVYESGGPIPGSPGYIIGERSDGEPGHVYKMPDSEKAEAT